MQPLSWLTTIGVVGTLSWLSLSFAALANVPLRQAKVQNLRNQVRLLLQKQPPRAARLDDRLRPGDALATQRSAFAELRFNDNSLARIGELSVFRFQPNTRVFFLDNGTVLLLIPPGQGTTRVNTPSATLGIRGSALFVRHRPDKNLTAVGALTDSQIEVCNPAATECRVLQAGQMAVLVAGQLVRVFNFDLQQFYATSKLAAGVNPLDLAPEFAADPAIAAVQAEMLAPLNQTAQLSSRQPLTDSAFLQLTQPGDVPAPAASLLPVLESLGALSVQAGVANTLNTATWLRSLLDQTPAVVGPAVLPQPPTPPIVPGLPSLPAQPGAPTPPATPANPGQPGTPATPAIPAVPGQPGTPATPAVPAVPPVP